MTNSVLHGLDAVQAEFFALIEGDPELRTAFTAIAESIESGEASVFERSMSDWLKWLDDEGYSAQTVQDNSNRFVSLLHDAGISHLISGDTKTSYLVQELKQVPHLLELLFTLFDHSLTLHSDVVGAAGGTGLARGKIVAKRLGVDRKKLAIREGAGEAREASSEFDSTARKGQNQGVLNDRGLEPRRDYMPTGGERDATAMRQIRDRNTETGRNGAGTEPKDMRLKTEKEEIRTARESRENFDDRGLEPRRDYTPAGGERDATAMRQIRDRNTETGRNGAGTEPKDMRLKTEKEEIRTAGESRENFDDRGLEPRRDYTPAGGELDARAEMRETKPGSEGATENRGGETQGEADRISTAREGRYVTREDGLNDRGLEPRRDYMPTDGELDARAEMRETKHDMLGANE